MSRTVLITGISGQDGSYLCELLLEKDYDVHGIVRRTSQFNRGRIEETQRKALESGRTFHLHYGNLGDSTSLHRIVSQCKPDEVYNLASQSHVGVSYDEPEYSTEVNATGVLRLLECVRITTDQCRFYQASTSEFFGQPRVASADENTPFEPRSPYAISKLYAYWMIRQYRDAYGMHASNGILFNHESPRRGENFVTRKITYSLARIRAGLQTTLRLGNLDSQRDWGYAGDYVEAMWLMLQQDEPDDYVIATGERHSVREFVEHAASIAGFDIEWQGEAQETKGIDRKTGQVLVTVDPDFYRPIDIEAPTGDASKARKKLGWSPRVTFPELVERMMRADLDALAGHG
jgi:GDPmannose 4,6-dehydratase